MGTFGLFSRRRALVAVAIMGCSHVVARDVPMKKAIPPLMDPIPTLPEITHRVYFEVSIDGRSAGKILFGLFGNNAPEATKNFVAMASCRNPLDATSPGPITGTLSGKPLCYKGTTLHRIIPNFAFQGGDVTHGDGTGGESIYGGTFASRMLALTKFNRPYMLAVAATHKTRAGSQFFVTTVKAQWLTGKHVIFGTVLDGLDVVKEIEQQGTYGGIPRTTVTITDCGEEDVQPEDKEPHY